MLVLLCCLCCGVAAADMPVRVEFDDMPLAVAVQEVAQAAGYTLANPQDVCGRVSARFDDLTPEAVLRVIADAHGYAVRFADGKVWLTR
jgi:ferric-dicitrate binding protein FerR (iron transport regulator)